MINVNKLTKDYGNRRAINEITFEAHKGEVVGFLGPQWRRKNYDYAHPYRLYAPHLRQSRDWRL